MESVTIVAPDGTALADNTGVKIQGGGGGGTQYADNAATPAHPTGTMPVFDKGGTISKVGTGAGQGMPMEQGDLAGSGTLTATQATANTPAAGGTVQLALAFGQGTWAGQILATNGGGLGSVLQWEYSEDGATTWNSTSVRTTAIPAGIGSSATLTGTAQTVTWRGSCAGWTHVRVRCASYTASDVLPVRLTASTGADITTGMMWPRTNAVRNTATLHRSAITAADKVVTLASASVTASGQTGGSLTTSTTYFWCVVPGNKYGTAGIPASGGVGSTATSTNTAIRLAFAAVTGAEYYDLFLSTDAAPKLVGRITEAQRATGGLLTVASTGTAGCTIGAGGIAGAIDVRVPGTGQQTSAANLAQNNAYLPDTVAGVGYVTCAGYSTAHIQVAVTLTDLFTAPTLALVPFLYNDTDGFYHQATAVTMSLLTAVGQAQRQDFVVATDGASRMVVCLGSLAGNNLTVSVWAQTA
jgi:hypothetical protein